MEYFMVKNWRKYQHYSDRNPPWIKLHFELLSSQDWVMLADASRCLLVACMLIASRNEGKVPANEEYMKRVAYLNRVDFNPLINIGFLESASSCKQMLADARPETETETETEVLKETPLAPHRAKSRTLRVPPVSWEGTFSGITEDMAENWAKAYPAVDVAIQLRRMDEWLISNPTKRKKNYYRFITNWFARQQERGR